MFRTKTVQGSTALQDQSRTHRLLCSKKGTAKSTLVRALGGLVGVWLVELPVSTSEDMLLGGVDLELAVRTGRQQLCPVCTWTALPLCDYITERGRSPRYTMLKQTEGDRSA